MDYTTPSGRARTCRRVLLFAPSNAHNARLRRCTTFPGLPRNSPIDVNRTSIEASKWAGVLSTVPDRAAIATTTAP